MTDYPVILRALVWLMAAIVLTTVLRIAESIVRHRLELLAAAVGLASASWLLGRWHARRSRGLGAGYGQAAELGRLRDDNAKLRTKVQVLSDMLNDGPEARP